MNSSKKIEGEEDGMIEKFKDWYENRHEYARNWKKETGGKVMGYFCTYVPEEILYAADVLPVRILGSHEPQSVTEPYLFAMYCPFCRDCLAQGLEGKYDYLDGVMIAQSCIHIRQTYFTWEHHLPTEFNHYLSMPNNVHNKKAALPFLKKEYEVFIEGVEKWTGRKITDEDLDRGIEIVNRDRQVMRDVYETRKASQVPISGLESMYMVVSSQLTHKEEHSRVVGDLLKDELPGRTVGAEDDIRLMTIGSENDDVRFTEMVESVGGNIVVDDHCTGTRYFWQDVEPQEDRLAAIAERYIDRTPCPTKDWMGRTRYEQIKYFVREFDVKGVILIQQKFCDPHEISWPSLREVFEDMDVKTLTLEFDVTVPLGPFRIRVEAFLETLGGDELF